MFKSQFLVFCPNITKFIERYADFSFFASKQQAFFKKTLDDLFEKRLSDPEAPEVIVFSFKTGYVGKVESGFLRKR